MTAKTPSYPRGAELGAEHRPDLQWWVGDTVHFAYVPNGEGDRVNVSLWFGQQAVQGEGDARQWTAEPNRMATRHMATLGTLSRGPTRSLPVIPRESATLLGCALPPPCPAMLGARAVFFGVEGPGARY